MTDLHALVDILVVLVAAKVAAEIAERIHFPAVVGEILAGILIGPSMLGMVETTEVLQILGEMGVILLLLDVGLEMDLGELRAVGRSALAVALVGIAAPFLGGIGVGAVAGWSGTETIFVAAALTATSVGISARVFGDLRALGTTEARTVLGAAIADDVIGLVMLTIVVRLADAGSVSPGEITTVLLAAVGFLALALIVGIRLVPPLFDAVTERSRSAGTLVALAFAFALGVAELASLAKLAPIVGAFVAGLALAPSRAADRVRRELSPVGHLLVPVFFLQIGIQADVSRFADVEVVGIASMLCVVGVVGKVIGGWAAGTRAGDRWLIGIGMVPRGEVGLIFAAIGLRQGVFGEDVYAALLLLVLVTTLATPPVLRWRVTGGSRAVAAVPDEIEPVGGWLRVSATTVELAGVPGADHAAAVALDAATQAASCDPGPELLAWLGALREDDVLWNVEATRSFRRLLRASNVRSWRVLYGTGALSGLLPDLDQAIRARDEEFAVDPWASLRFDRLARMGDESLERGDDDPVPLAALALDATEGVQDRALTLARGVAARIGQSGLADRAAALASDEQLLRSRIGRPDATTPRSVLILAAYLGSATAAEDLVRLTRTDGSLDAFDRNLLQELGELVIVVARRHDEVGGAAQERRQRAGELVEDAEAFAVLDNAPESWLLEHDPFDLAWMASRVAERPEQRNDVRVHVRHGDGSADVTVIARDRVGLLANSARAVAETGLDIVSASIATWSDGRAISTFNVRGFDRPSGDRISAATRAVMSQPLAAPAAPDIALEFHTSGSPWHTTCHAEGPDRFGLLWIIATAFAACEINVHSARISTVAGTAVNVFELSSPSGGKLSKDDQRRALTALANGSATPRRRRGVLVRRT